MRDQVPVQGTELGLAVIWNLVRSLFGWFELESQPGSGTVFHIYFPVPTAPPSGVVTFGKCGGPGFASVEGEAGMGMLLVEGIVVVAEMIKALLTRSGHGVTYA